MLRRIVSANYLRSTRSGYGLSSARDRHRIGSSVSLSGASLDSPTLASFFVARHLSSNAAEPVYTHSTPHFHSSDSGSSFDPVQLLSSHHNKLLDTLALIPAQVEEIEARAENDEVYVTEAAAAQRRSGVYYRQINIEEEQMQDAVNTYTESLKELLEMGKGTNLKFIQRILLDWYEPLSVSLSEEIKQIQLKVSAPNRNVYGPCLLLLPVEKLAVLTLNTVLNSILRSGNVGVNTSQIAMLVGQLVEAEVNINKLKLGQAKTKGWQADLVKSAYNSNARAARATSSRIRYLLGDEPWSSALKVKVGSVLMQLLLDSAKHGESDAFIHTKWFNVTKKRMIGMVRLNDDCFKSVAEREMHTVLPRYLPMIVPPKEWDNKRKASCYFRLKSTLMRTYNRSQMEAVRRADMAGVLEGLNFLGQVPWIINRPIFNIFKESLDRGIVVGELPNPVNFPDPDPKSCYTIPSKMEAMDSFYNSRANKKAKAKAASQKGTEQGTTVDEKGNVVMVDGKTVEAFVADAHASLTQAVSAQLTPKADLDSEQDSDISSVPDEPVFDQRLYNEMCRRVKLKNAELHSLRCDTQLKYWVAEKFLDDVMYFPVNMDFRGRAYPIPSNLSHLGSDLCRGMMTFAERKPLGEEGMFWLKVHVCNLFGNNKMSFDKRAKWTDDHIAEIYDSASNPLEGARFWATAEEPFQALAAIYEIVSALESGDPATYCSGLPIHMDGSCNGLQHYAALGRDQAGGAAVNLCPSDEPQDVYSKVLDIVLRKMKNDRNSIPEEEGAEYVDLNKQARQGEAAYGRAVSSAASAEDVKNGKMARFLDGKIDRKVIKQTVMTSVYGVTRIGARAQVQARLEEKFQKSSGGGDAITTPERDRELFDASRYVANMTLNSLEEMFAGAKSIMDWLATCAHLVAKEGHVMSWVTPMGLPVMQPYRQYATQTVNTTMQSITLAVEDEALPVSTNKQRSAFPPNFVHSLDATHMLMTSLRMKDLKLTYASVHDSYWTHAGDIPVMSHILRECFVELYSQPLLEDLRDSLIIRYPDINFPPVPAGGNLDLHDVLKSKYFFH